VIGFLVALAVGFAIGYFIFRRKKLPEKLITHSEYWVYIPDEKMPDQNEVMTRMVAQNPHGPAGQSPIGHKEGLLFSDIRLHIGLVLRRKNPHVFRPDLFSETQADAEALVALASAQGMVKIRYLSEVPLTDDRHMRFLPHLADAYSHVGNALLIYDSMAERLMTPSEFYEMLHADPEPHDPAFHVRILWLRDGDAAYAATKGLVKKGLPELNTALGRPDNQLLLTEVLREVAAKVWNDGAFNSEVRVECFGDEFIAMAQPGSGTPRTVHIQRVQTI
jgi:hypothetical protein